MAWETNPEANKVKRSLYNIRSRPKNKAIWPAIIIPRYSRFQRMRLRWLLRAYWVRIKWVFKADSDIEYALEIAERLIETHMAETNKVIADRKAAVKALNEFGKGLENFFAKVEDK